MNDILKSSLPFRIGEGYDLHRLSMGRRLILGGVEIEYECGLYGHSDADCLTHAIMNAVIGALGLGDIGQHFPDTEHEYEGISSIELAEKTFRLMDDAGYMIGNIDCTVQAQAPKLAKYKSAMEEKLASVYRCGADQINIKATTGEHIGIIGRGEAIAARAVCLLFKKPENTKQKGAASV
ncbi:MAG TPA: 2-C-methyl-D-erythritol 2,4-cyclodiphosphate synthase [Clostridiales bacterium]|jgi:2-C-methyl-D-erythritol 2,4-cyclodiphosphate synthase|nr:2-C-methyl-D-erythritol 2,4-cyclodiphosphate synthase [Clostridiales bacterium]